MSQFQLHLMLSGSITGALQQVQKRMSRFASEQGLKWRGTPRGALSVVSISFEPCAPEAGEALYVACHRAEPRAVQLDVSGWSLVEGANGQWQCIASVEGAAAVTEQRTSLLEHITPYGFTPIDDPRGAYILVGVLHASGKGEPIDPTLLPQGDGPLGTCSTEALALIECTEPDAHRQIWSLAHSQSSERASVEGDAVRQQISAALDRRIARYAQTRRRRPTTGRPGGKRPRAQPSREQSARGQHPKAKRPRNNPANQTPSKAPERSRAAGQDEQKTQPSRRRRRRRPNKPRNPS
ncbi:MAG: hypothetical protein ACE366_12950 [Bradymonadia bacterium]